MMYYHVATLASKYILTGMYTQPMAEGVGGFSCGGMAKQAIVFTPISGNPNFYNVEAITLLKCAMLMERTNVKGEF